MRNAFCFFSSFAEHVWLFGICKFKILCKATCRAHHFPGKGDLTKYCGPRSTQPEPRDDVASFVIVSKGCPLDMLNLIANQLMQNGDVPLDHAWVIKLLISKAKANTR
eukprot:Gb_26054 [translate_table: standard]